MLSSAINRVSNFWSKNVTGSADADFSRGASKAVGLGLAAGVTALSGYAGYSLGAEHQMHDVVTHETVGYPETVSTQVGTSLIPEGNAWIYMPVYETHETGRTLYEDVTHHSVSFPHTALEGALSGIGVGVLASAAVALIVHAQKSDS